MPIDSYVSPLGPVPSRWKVAVTVSWAVPRISCA